MAAIETAGNTIVKTTMLAMTIVGAYVNYGDTVVDCTMGNGFDTLELFRMVGTRQNIGKSTRVKRPGRVYAFDVQDAALLSTQKLLEDNGYDPKGKMVTLIKESHDKLEEYFKEKKETISAVVFNLGFMPGQDKSVLTTAETTLPAIIQAINLVKVNGVVAVTVYPGHEEGLVEKEKLMKLLEELPAKKYHVAYIDMINQKKKAPSVFFITPKVKHKLNGEMLLSKVE